jgi:hypothetical protein
VRRLVDLHGGSVTVHSDGAGTGSRFVGPAALHGTPSRRRDDRDAGLAGRLRVALVKIARNERESLRIVSRGGRPRRGGGGDGPSGLALIPGASAGRRADRHRTAGFDGLELAAPRARGAPCHSP